MTTAEDYIRVRDLDANLTKLRAKVVRRATLKVFWERHGEKVQIAGTWLGMVIACGIFWYGVARAIDMAK